MLEAVPNNWRNVELLEIANLVGGGTPSRRSQTFFQGSIPWVTGSDFLENSITWIEAAREYITDEAIKTSATNLVLKDSILLTTRVNVGKVAIAQVSLCFSQDITAVVPKDAQIVDFQFLAYFFLANQKQLQRFNRGTTISGIRRNDLARLSIPLPPLPEQYEIVKILRQADRLRQLREEADKKADHLLFSIFNQMFRQPNPSWIKCKVSDVISLRSGKNIAAKPQPAQAEKWGILKISAVTYGKFRPQENKELPDDILPNLEHQVRENDLLITRANTSELVGASCIARNTPQNLLLPDKIWRAVFDGKYKSNPYFLYGLFNTPEFRKEISRRATGTSGSMKNISQSNLLDIKIQLPSQEEQQLFADITLSVWRDIHENQLIRRNEINNLFHALQHNAFVGILTKPYRDIHENELSRFSKERDRFLFHLLNNKDIGAFTSEVSRRKIYLKLSPFQKMVMAYIEDKEGYSTIESLLSKLKVPSIQLQRSLNLLTQIGLIKMVKIAVAPGVSEQILFVQAYRPICSKDDVRETDLAVFPEPSIE